MTLPIRWQTTLPWDSLVSLQLKLPTNSKIQPHINLTNNPMRNTTPVPRFETPVQTPFTGNNWGSYTVVAIELEFYFFTLLIRNFVESHLSGVGNLSSPAVVDGFMMTTGADVSTFLLACLDHRIQSGKLELLWISIDVSGLGFRVIRAPEIIPSVVHTGESTIQASTRNDLEPYLFQLGCNWSYSWQFQRFKQSRAPGSFRPSFNTTGVVYSSDLSANTRARTTAEVAQILKNIKSLKSLRSYHYLYLGGFNYCLDVTWTGRKEVITQWDWTEY